MIRTRSLGPSQGDRVVDQRVLAFARFSVIEDLLRGGLTDVDDRQQTEVPIRDQARPGTTHGGDSYSAWPRVAALLREVGGWSHERSCVTSFDVRRLRQLLGDDAGQRAENLFSLLDGKGHPQPLRNRLTVYLAAARGGQRRFEIDAWQPSLLSVPPALLVPLHQSEKGRQPDDRQGWRYLTRCD